MAGILDLFVPRERKFFGMLQDLSEKIVGGATAFMGFINDYGKLSGPQRRELIKQLHDIEHECDQITHNIAIELNKTFLTPIDREDIHRLSTLMDDVMDIIYNIGHKLLLYDIKKIPRYMPELAKSAVNSAGMVNMLISQLGKGEKVGMHIRRVHELEQESDSLRNEAFAYLFKDSLPAVDIVKLKDLYEWLEAVTDKAEDIADVVEGIVIKYA